MPHTAPSSIPSSPAAPSPIRAPTAAPNASASSASRSLRWIASITPSSVFRTASRSTSADDVAVAQALELGADLAVELRDP